MREPSELEGLIARLTMQIGTDSLYNGKIYHYTSPVGFNSILFENNNDVILWASRYDCLNDESEGKIALQVYKEVCEEMLSNNEISQDAYELFIDIKPNHTSLISYSKDDLIKGSRLECTKYVCSFSKNSDSLAMWNYYVKGSNYAGFNLEFNTIDLRRYLYKYEKDYVNYRVASVVYDKDEQKSIIHKVIYELANTYTDKEEMSVRYIVSHYLSDWSLVFKSNYFKHEEEVRLIIEIANKEKNKSKYKIEYRTSNGLIIPFIKLVFEKRNVLGCTFGPTYCSENQKEVQKSILNERLKENGYPYAYVNFSGIPVRY